MVRKPAVEKAERSHAVALRFDPERQEHLGPGARIAHMDEDRLDLTRTTDRLEPCDAPVE
jgi:hypothetical protein